MAAVSKSKASKRISKLYGDRGQLASSFIPAGRTASVIYAVVLVEHPDLVKVGRTTRWETRRKSYANWNLRNGDGIAEERVFTISESFVDLPKLEAHVLASMPFPIRHGAEWFAADLDEVCRVIDRLLCEAGLSYV